MSFARRIAVGAALAAAVPLLFAFLIYLEHRTNVPLTRKLIERDQHALNLSTYLERLVIDMETAIRGFQVAGRENYLERYVTALRESRSVLRELDRLLETPSEKRLFLDLRTRIERWRTGWAEPSIAYIRENPPRVVEGQVVLQQLPANLEIDAGKHQMDAIRGVSETLVRRQRDRIARELRSRDEDAARLSRLLWIGAGAFSLLLLFGAWSLFRLYDRRTRTLFEGIRAAEQRDYRPVALTGRDEPARIAGAFNRMMKEVERRDEELRGRAQQLQEARGQLASILDSVGEGVVVADRDGKFTLFNPAAERILGLGETPTGPADWPRTYGAFLPDGVTAFSAEDLPLVRAIGGESPDDVEMFIRNPQVPAGVSISVSGRPIRDVDGTIRGGVVVFRDTTESKRAERELRRAETFLESIIKNIPNMIFVKDAEELRFVRFNRAGEELTGLSQEEVLGKNDYDFFPKEQADFFVAKDRAVLQGRKLVDIPEEPIQTRHQGTRLLNTKKIPILDGEGTPLYLLGISEDITERKRAEEQIARFFSVSLDLLCIAGFDGYFKRLNPAWEKTLGFATAELLSKPFIEFVHPEDRAATLAESAKLDAQEHDTVAFANRYRCADGTYKWLVWNSRSDHRYRLIYAAARDVTEEKRTQEQIRELNEELRHRLAELDLLNKELEAFSYSVSHDLRAPLRHVSGFAELLIKHSGGGLDEKGRRFLDTISESARRMGRLIDDLLIFSRMGRAEMRMTRVPMAELVAEVRRDFQSELAGREVAWSVNGLPEVRGDPAMLRLVLVNLLSNALKYTSTRPRGEIEIGSYPEADETVFFIRDNGVGFDMKYVDKLFGVFQRLHRTEEFEGTGIGLANVRRIVHRHGGRTWAEGAAGAGAVFYFSLPHLPESNGRPEEAS